MSIINKIRQYRLVSISLASYSFSPGVISSIVTIALLYTMVALGFWQLDRAEFKETLQQTIVERKNLPPAGIEELPSTIEDRRYLPLRFTAEYDPQHSFLLDNKILNGRVGYHVFTPAITINDRAILIARGFLEMGASRDTLPDIDVPEGAIVVQGLLDQQPSRTLVLAENVQQTNRWPVLLQYVDLDEIGEILGYEMYDMVLWLDQDNVGVFEYDLPVLNLN